MTDRQPAHMIRLAKIEDRITLVTAPLIRRMLKQGFSAEQARAEAAAAGQAIYEQAIETGEL
jgi:hypothetical protein